MSRNFILVLGSICWIGVAAVAVVHVVEGDFLTPIAVGLAFVLWTTLRIRHFSRVAVEA
jgi:hypothetical protein